MLRRGLVLLRVRRVAGPPGAVLVGAPDSSSCLWGRIRSQGLPMKLDPGTRVGNSLGVNLPKDALGQMGASARGDQLDFTEAR